MLVRPIPRSELSVSGIAMGCWPITGITSLHVTEELSLRTLEEASDAGITFFDTAYCYGKSGESERMIGRVLGPIRDRLVIASKGGIHWEDGRQQLDGRPETLKRECEESLRRLQTDRIDIYFLHAPDPNVPVSESAGAIRELQQEGKVHAAGASNVNVSQMTEFDRECPLAIVQPHYNMLQREIEAAELPWCIEHDVAVAVYWPLLKGLLAGKLGRDFVFDPKDGRRKYPMFQGEEWQKNQDFLDEMRAIASDIGRPLAQVVINWTLQRSGITAVLCGAKRPDQIRENADAGTWELSAQDVARIDAAIAARGPVVSRAAV